MKRIFLAFIAIFLIVIGAILYDVRTAMAASTYDTLIADKQIETLDLRNTTTQTSRSYSLDWYTEAQAALKKAKDKNISGASNALDTLNNMLDSDDAKWAVFANDKPGSCYRIFYTHDPTAYMDFSSYMDIRILNIRSSGTKVSPQFCYYPGDINSSENGTYAQITNGSISWQTQNDIQVLTSNSNQRIFLSTYPVEYPADYEGEQIQETWNPYNEIVIDYFWSITPTQLGDNNKQGKITFGYDQSKNNINIDCQGEYYLKKMAYNWSEPKDYEISEINGPIQTYKQTFDLTGAGYYTIYLDPEPSCDILIPRTNISSKVMDIYWDGETIRQGSSQLCKIGSPDPCNNIQAGDQSLLQQLVDNINLELHGFEKILTAPLTFLAAAESRTCQPLQLPFPHLGNITAPCMTPIYKQHFDPWFTAIQTIVTGVFMYAIAINFIATFKNIRNPQDDKIEVAKL